MRAEANILVVDHDGPSRRALKDLLTRSGNGYEVWEAANEKEAMALIAKQPPDLILIDVVIPQSDGFDLCLLLKADERYRNIPILIVTSLDKVEYKIKGFKVGASDYLVKPVNEVETLARVQAHLRIKRYQDHQRELRDELRRTHEALLEQSKMSAMGAMAAGVAHEFNNLLQIISASSEAGAVSIDSEEWKEMCKIIRECAERGSRIVKGLLDFSRRDEFQKKERFDFKQLLLQNLSLMDNTLKDHRIETTSRLDEVGEVEGYPGQLSRVFVSLINNAVDAMSQSPTRRLTVTLKRCACEGELCGADVLEATPRGKGCIVASFTDTGVGVAESVRDKLFQPFVTTKGVIGGGNVSSGPGLSLSGSYGIMRRHGGFIRFESMPGRGATFSVYLRV